jgi:hypothetical protein
MASTIAIVGGSSVPPGDQPAGQLISERHHRGDGGQADQHAE